MKFINYGLKWIMMDDWMSSMWMNIIHWMIYTMDVHGWNSSMIMLKLMLVMVMMVNFGIWDNFLNSSLSNKPSKFSTSSFNFILKSINLIKLKRVLRPTLVSFNQLLFLKMKISRLSNYKWYLFKFVNLLAKENICCVSIWKLTILNMCQIKKPIVENMDSYFFYHSKGHLMLITST